MDPSLVQWLLNRAPLKAWTGEDKIPWNEPEFSRRMLEVHLDQSTGLASRPFAKIDRHVQFIHHGVLDARTSRILDLGCGPGLYAHRLVILGHEVAGIDFSPASTEYAKSQGGGNFTQDDLLQADFGEGHDLVTFLFGEPNTFSPSDLKVILGKAYLALKPGGKLLLEVTKSEAVRGMGDQGQSWAASEKGLFHPAPHFWLQESVWDDDAQAAKTRWHVLPEGGDPFSFGCTTQAWTEEQMRRALGESGFQEVSIYPSMTGKPDPECPEALAWLSVRPCDDGVS